MKSVAYIILLFVSLSAFAQEHKVTIDASVTSFANVPIEGEQILFIGTSRNNVYKAISDEKGKFKIELEDNEAYQIKIKSIGEAREYDTLKLFNRFNHSYWMTIKVDGAWMCKMDNVHFHSGSTEVTDSSYKEMKELLKVMKLKPSLRIEIIGHTDDIGDDAYNLKLSEARSETIRTYLLRNGISSDRVVAKGYGEMFPISTNTTEEGRQKNRRTVVNAL